MIRFGSYRGVSENACARHVLTVAIAMALSSDVYSQSASQQASGASSPEELVITGSHIRGVEPVGVNLITIQRADIEKGGFTRFEEILRTLPQNFRGGPSEDTYSQQPAGNDRAVTTNVAKSSSVNLRGLGAGTTLVLIDGRRLSPSGSAGLFTDISNIPVSAIERVEILTDGASALYGSDAVGGVVNVIMRKDFSGAETSLRSVRGTGGTEDYQLSQVFGRSWERGRAQISYEYVKRDGLRAISRSFSADSDQRRNGGDNFSNVGGNPGTVVIGTRNWAIPANQDGTALTAASFVEGTINYRNESKFLWLLPAQDRHGVTASFTHGLTDRLTFWMQGMADKRTGNAILPWGEVLNVPRSNAFYVNPTGGTGAITVRYDMTEDFVNVFTASDTRVHNINLGFDYQLPKAWKLGIDYSLSEENATRNGFTIDRTALATALADSNRATALNPFGDGPNTNPATIDKLRASTYGESESQLDAINILADGPLLQLPGGSARLAVGAEHRDYGYQSSNTSTNSVGTTLLNSANDGRQLNAYFAELRVPVVGEANRLPGIESLTLSAAVRQEEYSDFGDSTVTKFGFSWTPVPMLDIRASVSESFRAPDLSSLDESRNSFLLQSLPDASAPGGTSTVLRWSGGNAQLEPETADNFSAGFDLRVPYLDGLDLSLTYFDITYENRIGSPFTGIASNAEILASNRFSTYVVRNPNTALRELVCSGVPSSTSKDSCLNSPVTAVVDFRTANTAVLETSGFDVGVNYTFATGVGAFAFALNATYLDQYEQANVVGAPLTSLLNRRFAPIDTRIRASLGWNSGNWSSMTFVNFIDDYIDNSTAIVRKVSSWTTLDVDVTYRVPATVAFLEGMTVGINAQNLLNRDPPWVNTRFGYDSVNANPYGRVLSFQFKKQW